MRHFATTVFDAGKLKPEYLFKRIIHFYRIQNIHSNKYSFFKSQEYLFKTNIHFQNIEYSFRTNVHFLKKKAVSPTPMPRWLVQDIWFSVFNSTWLLAYEYQFVPSQPWTLRLELFWFGIFLDFSILNCTQYYMLTNFTPQQRLQILPSESSIRKLKKQTPLKRAGSSVGLGLQKSKLSKNENYKYDESLESKLQTLP